MTHNSWSEDILVLVRIVNVSVMFRYCTTRVHPSHSHEVHEHSCYCGLVVLSKCLLRRDDGQNRPCSESVFLCSLAHGAFWFRPNRLGLGALGVFLQFCFAPLACRWQQYSTVHFTLHNKRDVGSPLYFRTVSVTVLRLVTLSYYEHTLCFSHYLQRTVTVHSTGIPSNIQQIANLVADFGLD